MSQKAESAGRSKRSKRREPLELRLTVVVRTGDAPEDHITVMDDRKLRMAGNVFEYRDRIQRFFVTALLKAAATSPAVYRELAPGLASFLQDRFGRGRSRHKAET